MEALICLTGAVVFWFLAQKLMPRRRPLPAGA